MSEEIRQVFGFDAAQALSTLSQLDSAFAKFSQTVNQSAASFANFNQGAGKTVSALHQMRSHADEAAAALGRLSATKAPSITAPTVSTQGGQAAAASINNLLGQTSAHAATAAGAFNNLGNQATNALTRSSRSASNFALSLETITRVIGTQVIVRALNSIRSAVEDSFQGFIDFNRALAEIQTISPDSLEQLGSEVRRLSDDFNTPILDVARAKYEILSNGFETTAESSQVLVAALKLSKVGLSDVGQAADLISTTLNAYGKTASEAETISAKLFKTIELGRVKASELASAFGRVAPVAAEIGATEDEMLAAFSSITIGGVNASEAATQIRASLSALLKPSKEAEEALRKLGFETGEQLIQARGYRGALEALIGTTDGSTTAIAKLFPNIRALNAVLREAGGGADIFDDHLRKIEQTSREVLNKKFEVRISSDAERVAADFQKLSNFFRVDLGAELVAATSKFLKFTGGADTAINAMGSLAPAIGFTTAALAGYATTMGVASAINTTFSSSANGASIAVQGLRGSLLGLSLGLAAKSLGEFIGTEITDQITSTQAKLEDAARQLLDFQRGQAEARANLDKIEADRKFRLLQDTVSIARKAYFEQADAASEANKQLLDDDKATFDKIISARERFATDLKRATQQAANDIVESRKRVADTEGRLSDTQFNFRNSRFNELTQFSRERNRALELAKQAAAQLGSANRPEDREAALSAFQRAEAFAQQAVSSAATTKNVAAQVSAERVLEEVLKQRLSAERQFQETRDKAAKKLEEATAKEQARVTKLKDLAKDVLANLNLFTKSGDLLPKEKIDANLKVARAKLDEFTQTAFGPGAKFDLDDLFSIDKLEQRLNAAFTGKEIDALFASPTALESLRNQIQGALDKSDFVISIAPDPSKLEGLSRKEQIDEVSNQLTAHQDALNANRTANVERVAAENEISKLITLSTKSLREQKGVVESIATGLQGAFSTVSFKGIDEATAKLAEIRLQMNRAIRNPNVSAEEINSFARQLTELQKVAPRSLSVDIGRAAGELSKLNQVYERRQQLIRLESQSSDGALQSQLQMLDATSRRALIERTTAATVSNAFGSTVEASAQILRNMKETAVAAAEASKQLSPAEPQARALGGPLFQTLAAGGLAKGTDRIPALLSQNEVVINAQSVQRFRPQLQQIQAGVEPSVQRTSGGDTFNIGDININESAHPRMTAREIISMVRQAQRMGTGRSPVR